MPLCVLHSSGCFWGRIVKVSHCLTLRTRGNLLEFRSSEIQFNSTTRNGRLRSAA